MEPPWSLSLVFRPTVTPPCLNKGNLLLLRWSFLFLPRPKLYLTLVPGRGEALVSLSLSLTLLVFPFPGVWEHEHPPSSLFCQGSSFPWGAQCLRGASLVLRLYWCFVYPQASALLPLPLSLSDDLRNRELLSFDCSTCNTPLKLAPRLR